MNTEHTNQSSQAEPASHSPIDLQSIPERQRGFTAENIRDIAHECMRIGDNEQAEVVFAIADALRDGNLIIQSPAQQQAKPVAYLKTAAGVMQLSFEGNPVVNVGADIEVQADTVQPLHAHLPAQRQAVATQLVCDALIAIVSHSGDPAGTVAALAEWRKKAEAFTRNPAAQQQVVAVPDGVARAVEAVAAAIYFADSSDYLSTLWDTLRFLSPEIAAIAESDTRAAWERAEQDRAMLAAAPLSAALADIAAERRRQIEQERWTPDRDDRLLNGQLATAAGYYALAAGWPHERDIGRGLKPQYWPFNQEWWKPTTARHNLVKAGALIAAEIERIDRAAQKGGEA